MIRPLLIVCLAVVGFAGSEFVAAPSVAYGFQNNAAPTKCSNPACDCLSCQCEPGESCAVKPLTTFASFPFGFRSQSACGPGGCNVADRPAAAVPRITPQPRAAAPRSFAPMPRARLFTGERLPRLRSFLGSLLSRFQSRRG